MIILYWKILLKPANIMIIKSGVKVLDFGLAKSQTPSDETATLSNVVMGTPAYMAPEQREGRASDVRTDLYALGLVLAEMATGKRTPALDGLPERFAHVVERCLETDPDARWQSASDVRAELQWAAKPQPTRPTRRMPRGIWALAALGIAAVAAAGILLWRRQPQAPPLPSQFSITLA